MAVKVKGKGTMVERSPGHWWIRAYAGRNEKGQPIQVSRTIRGTKRQAQDALAELASQVRSGEVALPSDMTVGELLDRWLDHITPLREPGTIRGYRTHIKAIKEQIGKVKLTKLTALHVDSAYRSWSTAGLAPNTVHHRHAVIRTALHQAVRWGMIPKAVTDQASPPPLRSQPVPATEAATVRGVYEAASEEQPVLAVAIYLAAVTGLRRGELCALRWTDIDRGVLHVRQSAKLSVDGREVLLRDTKTHQGRSLALDEESLVVLATYKAELLERAASADARLRPDGFILSPHVTGAEPMKPDTLGQGFRRLARKEGVYMRFHDLRHFTATQLVASGMDPRTVANRLGHADPGLTLRVYSSFRRDRDQEAARTMAGVFRPAQEPSPSA